MTQAMIDYQKEIENKQNQQMEREEKADVEKLLKTFSTLENQLYPYFFQEDNDVPKKKTQKYSSTKVKARNLLTNASYRRFKNKGFDKPTFVVDIMTFLVQNLNLLGLERKLETDTERNHVKMIWDKCLPRKFTVFVLTEKNYFALSETQITYQKANDIVHDFIADADENFMLLKNTLDENIGLIRYVYSTYFPKIYNRTNVFGIRSRTVFGYNYQLWRNEKIKPNVAIEEKKVDAPAKNPAPYEKRVGIDEFEQKPLDKYQIQRVILSKPKAVLTKEMIDAKAA